jgi:hypothetical protein
VSAHNYRRRKRMKRLMTLIAVLAMALILALPAAADSWTDKVTGGGWVQVDSSWGFSFTVSVKTDGCDVSGQMEYSRPSHPTLGPLDWHATAECIGTGFVDPDGEEYVVVAGPYRYQYNPAGESHPGAPWIVAWIREGSLSTDSGYGDGVRIRYHTMEDALYYCQYGGQPGGWFWATVTDGNFNVRSK